MRSAQDWIGRLGLHPHPEGGFFSEVYRSEETIPAEGLPSGFPGPRSIATSIYYLLRAGEFSRFHRIQSDELWHWYAGGALEVFVLEPRDRLEVIRLGPDPDAGERFLGVVPARRWFAARCPETSPYALAGCTVAPGFDFADFEMATRAQLLREFPGQAAVIRVLTRDESDA